MPDHVHLVIARPHCPFEHVVNQLKGAATRQLIAETLHPHAHFATSGERPPKAFARGAWTVLLHSNDDIHRAIRYVEQNPVKDALPEQHWKFVTPFDPSITSV